MKAKTPFYGDRVDRKAKLAQRLYRNERRDRETTKYPVFEEDEDSLDYKAPTGLMPHTSNIKER